ncbi:MAG: DNA polymerase IV [Planctomycetes bacterium]|nr:DNA polymerase IV [Planctomycetota bacterium]MCB9871717.1 DNA polymerase IV [Planctomycetota bacterium]
MSGARTILHADMDAFYAAVEQRDDPSLRGKPVIVGGVGRRGVVSTASYEAREFGVRSAMPTARAKQLCPHGVFVRGRMRVYAEVSAQVREVFAELTPLVEPLSLDEAFLDVTGSQALFGDGRAIAERVRAEVRARTDLTISVGVASSKLVAKIASDLHKPDGLTVVPDGDEIAFLAPLPIARLWGVGPRLQEKLRQLAVHRIGDLQRRSAAELDALFGEGHGAHYANLCRGIDDRPVEPEREAKSISQETTFEFDLGDRAACHRVLLEQSTQVGRRLRKAALCGALVRVKVRDPDFTTRTRQQKLPEPTCDDLQIYRTAVALFDALRANMRPVRLLGVGVAELRPAGARTQRGLFDGGERTRSAGLLDALDRIRDRFGEGAIRRGNQD